MEENKNQKPEFIVDVDAISARSESLKKDLDSAKEKPTDEEIASLIERMAKLRGMSSEEYLNFLRRLTVKAQAEHQQYSATHGKPDVAGFIDKTTKAYEEAPQESFTRR